MFAGGPGTMDHECFQDLRSAHQSNTNALNLLHNLATEMILEQF